MSHSPQFIYPSRVRTSEHHGPLRSFDFLFKGGHVTHHQMLQQPLDKLLINKIG